MVDDIQRDLPTSEPVAPSTSDIVTQAMEIANSRAADREAGKPVSDDLPNALPDRNRDDQGKFAPKPKPSKEPAKPAAAASSPQPAPAATSPEVLQPNPRWNDTDKANFARLAPDAQRLVLDQAQRQEADYTQKTQQLAEQRKYVEPFSSVFQEHNDFLQGVSQQVRQPPARIVGDVLSLYRQLITGQPHEKAQALGFVAQLAGIDLSRGQGVQAPDPIINDLRKQVADLNGFRQQTEAERQQLIAQQSQQTIEGFSTAKDEQGQLRYPHFAAVRGFMAQHVQNGASLEDAYAIAAKPIIDAIAAVDGPKRDAAANADRARAAAVAQAKGARSPRTNGSIPGGTVTGGSISEIVTNAMRAANYPGA